MSGDPFTDVAEFDDDAAYDWWRSAHPDGFVLAVRARKPPILHRAGCREIDRGEHRSPARVPPVTSGDNAGRAPCHMPTWLAA